MLNRELVQAPSTTTVCPNCGGRALVLIGSQDVKLCADCPTNIIWRRDPGQPATHGGTPPCVK